MILPLAAKRVNVTWGPQVVSGSRKPVFPSCGPFIPGALWGNRGLSHPHLRLLPVAPHLDVG